MRRSATMLFIFYVSVWLIVVGCLPDNASAMLIAADEGGSPVVASRTADLAKLQTQLESKIVSQRLADVGLTPTEVQHRLASLSDEQLHEVTQNLDGVQPGGDLLILILAIIGAVVVVLAIIGLARQA
jgi:hypothetical protein